MKAVEIYRYGGVEELKYEEAETPSIQPDEVLVRVYASGVNPVDWKMRKGAVKASEIARKPISIDHKAASGVALAGLTAWQGLFEPRRPISARPCQPSCR